VIVQLGLKNESRLGRSSQEKSTVHLWQQMMRSARGFEKNGLPPLL
jgi:hypothetical protein